MARAMATSREVSRRDFLRLRAGERGRLLELSCRTLFMRCADARIRHEDEPYEPWMGEPPTVVARASVDDLVQSVGRELEEVQLLRLQEPEWLDTLEEAPVFRALIDAFVARGGRVERA